MSIKKTLSVVIASMGIIVMLPSFASGGGSNAIGLDLDVDWNSHNDSSSYVGPSTIGAATTTKTTSTVGDTLTNTIGIDLSSLKDFTGADSLLDLQLINGSGSANFQYLPTLAKVGDITLDVVNTANGPDIMESTPKTYGTWNEAGQYGGAVAFNPAIGSLSSVPIDLAASGSAEASSVQEMNGTVGDVNASLSVAQTVGSGAVSITNTMIGAVNSAVIAP